MDSTVALWVSALLSEEVYPLFVEYGQRNSIEFQYACKSIESLREKFPSVTVHALSVVPLDVYALSGSGSALVDSIDPLTTSEESEGRPNTYIPGRNLLLLSMALSYSEIIGAGRLYHGIYGTNSSAFPDTSDEFLRLIQAISDTALRKRVLVESPLKGMSKAEVASFGLRLGVPFQYTWSCFEAGPIPCGKCDSCIDRASAFASTGTIDPLEVDSLLFSLTGRL